jgi:hypothetical protein
MFSGVSGPKPNNRQTLSVARRALTTRPVTTPILPIKFLKKHLRTYTRLNTSAASATRNSPDVVVIVNVLNVSQSLFRLKMVSNEIRLPLDKRRNREILRREELEVKTEVRRFMALRISYTEL